MILTKNSPLKKHNNYKIGGISDYFFEFTNREDLGKAINEYKDIDSNLDSVFVLGSGTNVLFSDDGFHGLVLKNSLTSTEIEDEIISVSSGTLLNELVTFASEHSLSGLEWAGGLPGTVGGAIRGNAGAFGGEVKDNIIEVESVQIQNLNTIIRNKTDCKFNYRQSVFKDSEGKDEVIVSAKFAFKKGELEEIKKKSNENVEYRRARHPLNFPNIGSIFKNIPVEKVPSDILQEFDHSIKQDPFPVLPVAKLIASSGLMGKTEGGAQISTKHPNFIVNIGNARADDVKTLMGIVKNELKNKYKVTLEEEITIL